jgi:AcrR family transcriptional regulator
MPPLSACLLGVGLRVCYSERRLIPQAEMRRGTGGHVLKEQRQEQIFHAAKIAFSEKGFYKTSIADIIQKAGVARGTFYLYFKNKQHIFISLLDALLQDIDERFMPVELGSDAASPIEQIKANLTRIIGLAVDEPQLMQTLFHHATGLDEVLDEKLDDFYDSVAERIEWALKLGIEMGLVRPCHTLLVAHSIMGSVKQVMGQLALERIAPHDFAVAVDTLLAFGLHGVLVEFPSS